MQGGASKCKETFGTGLKVQWKVQSNPDSLFTSSARGSTWSSEVKAEEPLL